MAICKGAAVRRSMSYRDPKDFVDGIYEAPKYAGDTIPNSVSSVRHSVESGPVTHRRAGAVGFTTAIWHQS
jgi:hypothetical protein